MIRSIRFLGAALGGLIGITLVISRLAEFEPAPGAAALVVAWVLAWIVLGFTLLPYLTVIPAKAALRAVQDLSTAEFVTAIIGLFLGPAPGPPRRHPAVGASATDRDRRAARRLGLPRARRWSASRSPSATT